MSEPAISTRYPLLVRLSLGLHAACAAALVAAPGRWRELGSVLALNHLVLAVACTSPRGKLLGANLSRLPRCAGPDTVALTFDDGPDPEVTPQVLELLARHRARATFFCVGCRAERASEIVAEIIRRGHRVENHTYGHANTFALRGCRAMGRDVDRAQEVLTRLTGRRPEFFRPPAGMRNPFVDPLLARRGLRLVSWSRRGFDAVERHPERVVRRLLRGLGPGDILLMHDGFPARDHRGRPVVLEALPPVLDELARRGLHSIGLPSGNWQDASRSRTTI